MPRYYSKGLCGCVFRDQICIAQNDQMRYLIEQAEDVLQSIVRTVDAQVTPPIDAKVLIGFTEADIAKLRDIAMQARPWTRR